MSKSTCGGGLIEATRLASFGNGWDGTTGGSASSTAAGVFGSELSGEADLVSCAQDLELCMN